MMIPRTHWHHYVGRPILAYTQTGTYCGHLQRITDTHLHLAGTRLAGGSTIKSEEEVCTLSQSADPLIEPVYFPGAALAIPLAAIVGVTALGLGAMGAW